MEVHILLDWIFLFNPDIFKRGDPSSGFCRWTCPSLSFVLKETMVRSNLISCLLNKMKQLILEQTTLCLISVGDKGHVMVQSVTDPKQSKIEKYCKISFAKKKLETI